MAYCDQVRLTCKNKLCGKESVKGRINGKLHKDGLVCNHCGFKTLDPHYIPPELFNLLNKAINKQAWDLLSHK